MITLLKRLFFGKKKVEISMNNTEEKSDGWLSRPRSGKKTSAILWILTFAISFLITMTFIGVNFYLIANDKSIINADVINSWVSFIEIWVYGLIWFSAFIAAGTTIKKVIEKPKEEANKFLDDLEKRRNNSNVENTKEGETPLL